MLSNLELLQQFVAQSVHKQEILLANSTLQAQTAYKINQIIAKTEGVIATAPLTHTPLEFSVKATSSHWELINEVLAEHNYILTGEIDSRNCYRYQYCQIPKGYQMHCMKSVHLWRSWWKYRKNTLQLGIPLDLLIRTRNSWYPVRDLTISDGLLYIKTLGSEIAVHSDDLVIWLSKIEQKFPNTTEI
ncbi:hypothetical protein ACN23B_22360 [Anabaena sp. FACHB-709]|uniref:Uncharacterized protein n=2 Tax=Nostocaceae TaxID=1162 RepID=A0A1Z4KM53_ANAVA|nr:MULTISPECIES: hypothetical protein [Nostocaceae]BAY70070.1 hypothetical protein NIES23_28700 [Trichormus variabilis NIES-23]HBW28856.1 hypothetical protein [Nostoc sp. UBA8866]MBD2175058.1 hypothetical protein [Anabaena cylindrica FACHB-318]MBD2266914.1 hypothetical protein [Anabaena sp. FACHB-709]MBD2276509.1 hypothetical protein [Nostoc sp. PCC 7120 = FACHB-418]